MARIIVVGAGMGGLAAASRLATLGHRVTVLEAAGTHGGQVGSYRREGFGFDTGPGLLALPAVYRDLALKTGREPLEQLVGLRPVDPESRHLFPDGTELLLEPDAHPAAKVFKAALVDDGIPFTSFAVDDIAAEFARLTQLGVRFTQEPVEMGPVTTAVLDDTCGNLIQIVQRR